MAVPAQCLRVGRFKITNCDLKDWPRSAPQGAIAVNIQIMRAFVRMRELLASNTALARKLQELERKYKHHDEAITAILSAIRELMNPPPPKRRGIEFTANLDES